jgi:alkylhydroperoxidase/carboxymuconolactone decarboxylase family protein YurZ
MADQGDLLARGREVTATLWGDLMKAAPAMPAATVAPEFFHLVTQFVFGMFWSRPNLALRDRSLCTVAQLAALGKRTAQGASDRRGNPISRRSWSRC